MNIADKYYRHNLNLSKNVMSNASGECNELELSNFDSLDSNIRNKFSSVLGGNMGVAYKPLSATAPKFTGKLSDTKEPIKATDAIPINTPASTPKTEDTKNEVSTDSSVKFMGMSKKTGLIVIGVLAIGVGTLVYFKFIKK